MKANDLKKLYVEFFEKKNHKRIVSAPLIPENDPTVLFTTAGMHPLVPFLMGEPHPLGNRIVNCQKCIRTGDIDEVGDATHFTFFEMMGNWSFGDYFKEEAIEMSFEFLTRVLDFPIQKLAVSCFAGDENAPRDEESAAAWRSFGFPEEKIAFLPKKDNWWGPAGETGPCGPDTEMFYWNGGGDAPSRFDPEDSLWVEIWNDVFMQYNKTKDGKYVLLDQPNVDTGLGLERVAMILQNKKNVYEIDTLFPVFETIRKICNLKDVNDVEERSIRIITDHMRASTFILGDERSTIPSNLDQGYILRRFIRRSIRHFYLLKAEGDVGKMIINVAKEIIKNFKSEYPDLKEKESFILDELKKESERFIQTIDRGIKEIKKKMVGYMLKEVNPPEDKLDADSIHRNFVKWLRGKKTIDIPSKWLFDLFQSYGMPPEISLEEFKTYKVSVPNEEKLLAEFQEHFKKHQELSRVGAEKRFKGGLADSSDMSKKLHTATHLLNEALRQVLGDSIKQRGSNITSERLRFDFNFDRKLTDEEKKQIEDLINSKIKEGLVVTKEKMPLEKALKSGAQAEFGAKYPAEVWVYTIGGFSKEICMGPHVDDLKDFGTFKIKKEQSSAAGIRRIKAVVE